jgi:fused signal recognition particle receptor
LAGLFDRFREGLSRTRAVLEMDVEDLVRGRRPLAESDLQKVEESLILADLGIPAVERAMQLLKEKSGAIAAGGFKAMQETLERTIRESLERPSAVQPFSARPWVVFALGVNGVGKTTTLGKLAHAWKAEGRSVLMVAADTFRAAAAEQLEIWAQRTASSFHRGAEGADPSAVLTDGLRMARARAVDAVLVDTAGRLHTKGNLMAELNKMTRVADREIPGAPHEKLLVLDATTGSNGLAQGREFAKAAGLTGLVLTKLDGTAKGGVAVAVVEELGVPIRYVGVGEGVADLLPFDAAAFAKGLFGGEAS